MPDSPGVGVLPCQPIAGAGTVRALAISWPRAVVAGSSLKLLGTVTPLLGGAPVAPSSPQGRGVMQEKQTHMAQIV